MVWLLLAMGCLVVTGLAALLAGRSPVRVPGLGRRRFAGGHARLTGDLEAL